MKFPMLFILLVSLLWLTAKVPANAQNPYPCDSLKLTFFDPNKIKITFFQAPKTCSQVCSFCKNIENQNWLEVQTQLRVLSKSFYNSPEPITNLGNLLLGHRMINFV